MVLTEAIKELLEYGRLSVDDSLEVFGMADCDTAIEYLRQRHSTDSLDMPYTAPPFHADAALWAAMYLCRATQIILLRDLDEKHITDYLADFDGAITPGAIYSADLTLRYMPDLSRLAHRISPEDVLTKYLRQTAALWPFSSVGLSTDQPLRLDVLLTDPSLTCAYADRIIAVKNLQRFEDPRIQPVVFAQLGSYIQNFWPELNILKS